MKLLSKLLSASKWKLVISSIGVLALVVFSGFVLFEATKAEVVVSDNGEEQTVKTHADTVSELLAEVGIKISKHDELSHKKDEAVKDGMNITYKQAHEVKVTIDGNKRVFFTTLDKVGEFLKEEGIDVAKHDELSFAKSDAINGDMELSIEKGFQVTINNGDKKQKIWATGGTVADVLKANDFSWDKSDKIKPGKDTKVNQNTTIKIVRVNTFTKKVEEPIAYEVEKRKDSSMEKGKENVISEGKEGLVVKEYKVTEENGKEVKRELIDKTVKQESENRVVAIGTKEEERNLVTLSSGGNDGNGKVYSMTVTAYSADCTGCSGYTATGINLNANPNAKVVSVDPSVIPLGTKVWVEGYGTAVAADTGGGVNGHHVDIHLPTRADALAYGTRTNVKVKILD
ncbi:G5 and 3D domain-containing protein [Virgibacillus doumboii]|uniref:G5 and 3D domain-containing protein n=1 Tax=Virgibacillus doumboii TaxID=2697503 RepID=UPI0013E079B6|nr:G5 and 3D domain-containing protein [Virgibacillus doumboii]